MGSLSLTAELLTRIQLKDAENFTITLLVLRTGNHFPGCGAGGVGNMEDDSRKEIRLTRGGEIQT